MQGNSNYSQKRTHKIVNSISKKSPLGLDSGCSQQLTSAGWSQELAGAGQVQTSTLSSVEPSLVDEVRVFRMASRGSGLCLGFIMPSQSGCCLSPRKWPFLSERDKFSCSGFGVLSSQRSRHCGGIPSLTLWWTVIPESVINSHPCAALPQQCWHPYLRHLLLGSVLEMPYISCRKVEDIFICTPGTKIPFRETTDFMEEKRNLSLSHTLTLTLEMGGRISKLQQQKKKKSSWF